MMPLVRCKIRPVAAVLAASGTAVAMALGTAATASAATTAGPAATGTCTTAFPIVVNDFAFSPATVAPGGSSSAILVATNCSNQAVTVSEMLTGQWIPQPGSTGLPSGCPVIDPLLRTVNFGPGAELVDSVGYLVPAMCTAAELDVTVRIYGPNGTVGVTKTAVLHIQQVVVQGSRAS